MKHEETGLIPSAAVVSADVLPDDDEFREQELQFSQPLLYLYLFTLYTYKGSAVCADPDGIHLVRCTVRYPYLILKHKNIQVFDKNRKAQYLAGTRTSISASLGQFLFNFWRQSRKVYTVTGCCT